MTDQEGSLPSTGSPGSGFMNRGYIPPPYREEHRLSDSYFFSERRLAQLFNVDAWTADEDDDDFDEEESHREPPPEPAPRASYCPPSPATAHPPSQTNHPFNLLDYNSRQNQFSSLPSKTEKLSTTAAPTRFSDDVAIDMARLSKLSSGSSLTTEEDDEDDSSDPRSFRYSKDSSHEGDVTPTPMSPASRQKSSPSRFAHLTTASSSLPSVLAGEAAEEEDYPPWEGEANGVNWQSRCFELEISLQRFRDQAGRIRELLREKLVELEQRVLEAEARAHHAEEKVRVMETTLETRKPTEEGVAEETPCQKEVNDEITTLSSQIEEQRLLRLEDAKKVEEKAARIKEWVTNKLKELEEQNAVLREQNEKCNVQLEMLKGRLAYLSTKRNDLDLENDSSRGSFEDDRPGSHESLPDRIESETVFVPERPTTLGRSSRSKSKSPISLRRASSIDNGRPYDYVRLSKRYSRGSKVDSGSIDLETPISASSNIPLEVMLSSLTMSAGNLSRKKASRRSLGQTRTKSFPRGNSGSSKSGDSLELNLKKKSSDSSHLDTESTRLSTEGRLSKAKDELHDYSEIYTPSNEFGPFGDDKPPPPPLHRFPSWESRIYQVAQKGLSLTDLGSDERLHSHSSGLGSYPEIHIPVYAAVKGRASQIRSVPFTGDSSDSSDGEDHCMPGGGVTGDVFTGRMTFANSASSNESSSSSPSKSKTSSSSPAKLAVLSPTKIGRRDISFESGMSSDDYAIPPDARSNSSSLDSAAAPTLSARTSVVETTTNTLTSCIHMSPFHQSLSGVTSPRGETSLEKSGYLTKLGGKLKTWKKRYFILKDGTLSYWKSQNEVHRKPAGEIALDHGCVITRSEGAHTFEVNTGKKIYYLTAENTLLVEEWVRVLQNVLRRNATRLLLSREGNKPTLQGWLIKVKNGHAKHSWCILIGKMFIYFKNPTDQTPLGQIDMKETRVEDVDRVSDSEGEENGEDQGAQEELTIGLFPSHQGPSYLICPSKHDKDSWLYHLTVVSGGGSNAGTQYEQFIQKLMEVDGDPNSVLWRHPTLLHSKEAVASPFTTLHTPQLQGEAVKLFKSCQLYTSVLMDSAAIDYHVVLCQNALNLCLSHPELQVELFCGLIKQTSAHMPLKSGVQVTKTLSKIKPSRNLLACATQSLFLCDSSGVQKTSSTLGHGINIDHKINPPAFTFIQGWQFLSLAVSLFIPKNNRLLWYLKVHIQRYSDTQSEIGKYAIYCQRALQRTIDNGGREAKPSRMEVLSILLKNPYHHSLPHAIPVHFLNGTYQVVGFDGSTTIEEFLSSLNQEIACRDVHQSGFALFSDDPIEKDLEHCLNPNAKLCDVISKWETALREKGLGKFENTKVIRLLYKNRLYWKYAAKNEVDREKLLLCYQVNEQIQQGKFPVTKELALELTTLLAQIDMGEVNTERSRGSGSAGPSAAHVQQIFAKFYPKKFKEELKEDDKMALLDSLLEKWQGLRGRNQMDCVRIFLTCTRKWLFFGATLFPATTTYPEYCDLGQGGKGVGVWVAVSEDAVSLLEKVSMQPIVRYHYGNVVTFGGCQEDFMLVVHTPEEEASVHPPGTHKLMLCMSKPKILELTLLIADYMNALGRGIPGTPQAGTLTRHGSCRSGCLPLLQTQISGGAPDILQMATEIDKNDLRKPIV